ncbi:UNVERIFIED_CONTAM: hypothetical protein PYX00_005754 [Menopon gallinae]|uniref:C2 domain-containing protein n=1 Tax=Menopon gallinae TaxID=328185 RepID=A0AAW2HU01_9NEOP
MATKSEPNKNEERRKRVFVGRLPPDFLRITSSECQNSQEQQEAADAQTALALQHQLGLPYSLNTVGRLSITVAQAKLVKNYGVARMDPYVILRVGHFVYETPADSSGGKNPKWNRVAHFLLPQGVKTIHIKIYDECSLRPDELIAWTEITIPENVMNGETCDDWFPLSGKQGERVEGMINLVISFTVSIQLMNYTIDIIIYMHSFSAWNIWYVSSHVICDGYSIHNIRLWQSKASTCYHFTQSIPG